MSTPITKLRELMRIQKLDAFLVITPDPHLSEYVPAHWATRAWVTNFHGSAVDAVVTMNEAALFTDSRYWLQAEEDLRGSGFELIKSGSKDAPTITEWLGTHLKEHARVGFELARVSAYFLQKLSHVLSDEYNLELVAVDDPFDALWPERPAIPVNPVYRLQGASAPVREKVRALRERMREIGVGYFVCTQLDEIAWLLNLRGSDIDYNPLFLSNLIVGERDVRLYTEASRFDEALLRTLSEEGVNVLEPEQFLPGVRRLRRDTLIDIHTINALTAHAVRNPITGPSPVMLMKSRKTAAELDSIRTAMIEDGVALVEFQKAFEEGCRQGVRYTELGVAAMLHENRARRKGFIGESFETIAAFGPNAALPHYTPSSKHDAVIDRGLLLIDSGAHYCTGTTDITRMFAVGELTAEEKKTVTTVLKGHIALARACVPAGTAGAQLDAYARAPLWQNGWDYGHGTGHGVGYVLNVHENAFSISPRSKKTEKHGLNAGIVVSNEPGLYFEGRWGVRIENLMAAVSAQKTDFGEFLRFETLTLTPIDVKTLDISLLDDSEIAWLDDYHEMVYRKLSPHLPEETARWLRAATSPLGG